MEEKKFWICANLSGLGPARLKKLLKIAGSIDKVFQLSEIELREASVPKNVVAKILKWEELPWQDEIRFCRQQNVKILTREDADYPYLLKQIYAPPFMLYVKGKIPKTEQTIAIIGTRNPSLYGRRMAEKFAIELAYLGFTIISGLARGIDTAAHKGALKGAGKTVGVLGSGFNNFYPRDNFKLAERILDNNGAIITEFNFSARPEPSHFPIRNRIVSGLSKGVLVIEAGQRSGALITANCALDQGREIFALPGQVDNIFSKGVNYLLKEGALLVENTQDILDSLNLELKIPKKTKKITHKGLTKTENKILATIGNKKMHIEELLSVSELKHREVSDSLLSLLIKGLIVELPGKIYSKK
ncbi:DNA-processing protein DprA [bacterium]|nr:DNA-processing protein DprA [bacterium]